MGKRTGEGIQREKEVEAERESFFLLVFTANRLAVSNFGELQIVIEPLLQSNKFRLAANKVGLMYKFR